jgi:ATP-dependent DNA helicase PIF1
VVVTAPTGLAAYNVNGLTIHRVFKIPVQQGDREKYYDLLDEDIKMLRFLMKNVRLIIIGRIKKHFIVKI